MTRRSLSLGAPTFAALLLASAACLRASLCDTMEQQLLDRVGQAESSGAENPRVAVELNALGHYYLGQHRLQEAESTFRRSFGVANMSVSAKATQLLPALLGLGAALEEQTRFGEAEYYLRDALVIAAQRTPTVSMGGQLRDINIFCNNVVAHPELLQGSIDVAMVLDALAHLFQEQNRTADAERLCERALEMYQLPAALAPEEAKERVLIRGYTSFFGMQTQSDLVASIVSTLMNMADIDSAVGKYTQAELRLKQALAIAQPAFGEHNVVCASILSSLAAVLRSQGRLSEAQDAQTRADSLVHE